MDRVLGKYARASLSGTLFVSYFLNSGHDCMNLSLDLVSFSKSEVVVIACRLLKFNIVFFFFLRGHTKKMQIIQSVSLFLQK